jgi:energy-coupling factor transporter ATP-binding protein EcfA2
LENKDVVQEFRGDYTLPEKWNIGLIVGNSGSGKTSIAKKCFGDFISNVWDEKPIIDNFKDDLKMGDITQYLGSVGFNSVPYWLKPYHVLSNGEKQRVDLARLASENDRVVFDEFSSLVDRDVAKSMSHSVQKLFRKHDKQLVCVTCHKDLNEWLQPDWIYDTDEKVFFCPKKSEKKDSSSKYTESKKNLGNFIKSIII